MRVHIEVDSLAPHWGDPKELAEDMSDEQLIEFFCEDIHDFLENAKWTIERTPEETLVP